MSTSHLPRLIILSDRAYRRLLRAYPARFRRAFGDEMAGVFRECCRDAYAHSGITGFARLWLSTLCDLAVSASAERLTEGIHMTRLSWVRLGALALLVGAAIQIVFTLSSLTVALLQLADNRTNAPHPIFLAQIASWELAPIPYLLLGAGLAGLHVLVAPRVGQLGTSAITGGVIGLALVIIGGVTAALFIHGQDAGCVSPTDCNFYDPNRTLLLADSAELAGFALFALGMALYGVVLIRAHALPRGNTLPLILGIVSPLALLAAAGAAIAAPQTDYAGLLKAQAISSILGVAQVIVWLLLARALWSSVKSSLEPEATAIQPAAG